MIWAEEVNPENQQQKLVDLEKVKKVIQETRKLLDSEDLFEIAIGGGRREALKELDLWEEGTWPSGRGRDARRCSGNGKESRKPEQRGSQTGSGSTGNSV